MGGMGLVLSGLSPNPHYTEQRGVRELDSRQQGHQESGPNKTWTFQRKIPWNREFSLKQGYFHLGLVDT